MLTEREFYLAQQKLIELGTRLRTRADNWEQLRGVRALKAYQAVGLGDGQHYDGCVFYNAYVGALSNQPWRGVDTKKLKRARYLDVNRWQAHHLVDAYLERKWRELFALYRG